MANPNIVKTPSHRTSRRTLRVIEGKGAPRQPLDLANLTVAELRTLLGEEYGPRLSDEGAEQVLALIRRLAAQQAPAPEHDSEWNLDKARVVEAAQEDTSIRVDWDVTAVVAAATTIDGALLRIAAWWDRLPSSDEEVQKGRTALAQLVDPFAAALPYLTRFLPREDYKPRPQNQIGPNKRIYPWRAPAVLLANMLDRLLRRPGDTKLPPFWGDSKLTIAVHAILADLDTKPPAASGVAAYLKRFWRDHGRLPIGTTDGPQLLREAALKQAKTPAAAEALDQLHRALLVREAETLRAEQLRHGTEEKERREHQASPSSSREKESN